MSAEAERSGKEQGEALSVPGSDEALRPRPEPEDTGPGLLSAVLARENMQQAWKRVRANKGAAGIDGLGIDETAKRLVWEWPEIREQLLRGTYRPQPVRRVTIPKPDGGQRELGIPTVTDRLIQQALLQVLQPQLDPTFSQHSYGFRPGRSAHQAVQAAQAHVESGRRVVVDVDLEKFFDRVNHDILIDRLRKRVADTGVIRLVRAYLTSGIMDGGVLMERSEGTPQGGPLSPLLANVALSVLDEYFAKAPGGPQSTAKQRWTRRQKGLPNYRLIRYADLCRARHKSAYAEVRVMPRWLADRLASVAEAGSGSA